MCYISIHLTGLLIILTRHGSACVVIQNSENDGFRNEVYAVTIDGEIQKYLL
jgi:thiamine phosphate synthase YjbQ (UPF0047 family)